MILQRSFSDAILDSLSQGLIANIVFLVVAIVCVLILRLRFPLPKKTLHTIVGLAVAILFVVPHMTQILFLIAYIIIIIGGTILLANLSNKLPVSRENILNVTQIASATLLLWASFSLVLGVVNATIAFASGTKSIPAQLINKFDDLKKERVLLMFATPRDKYPDGMMDVWLPISNSQAFTNNNCYEVEYYKSPFLSVEGRSDVYVTGIQNQQCKSSSVE